MPALLPTKHHAVITWLGTVPDSEQDLRASEVTEIIATFAGPGGDSHAGLTRESCSRVTSQYPLGTPIRNTRQFSILSAAEIAQIASEMGLEVLNPAWLGASMVIEGIDDFSHIPPSSRLQSASGATLTIDMTNRPCNLPARVIEDHRPGFGKRFKAAAAGLRGITAWVERVGVFRTGDELRLHVPDQRAWNPANVAYSLNKSQ